MKTKTTSTASGGIGVLPHSECAPCVEGNGVVFAEFAAGLLDLDGMPPLDIKPYVPTFDVFEVNKTGWCRAARGPVTADNRLEKVAPR